jgi:hypothetical protein
MRAQRARKGAEGTRPLRRISPARMPSSKKSDPAPIRETALRSGLATRRYTPVKTDADIEYMVAATGFISDCFDAVEEKFITVTRFKNVRSWTKILMPPWGPIVPVASRSFHTRPEQQRCRSTGLRNARHFTIFVIASGAALSYSCGYFAFPISQS